MPDEVDIDIEESEEDEDEGSPDLTEAMKLANKEVRDHARKVEKENRELRTQVLATHLTEIGLKADQGLGKAIAKEYTGEFSVEAIAEFARSEYGYESTPEQIPPEVQAQQRFDQIQGTSVPVEPSPQQTAEEIAAQRMHDPNATREDAQLSLTGKVLKFAQENYGPQGPQGQNQ